jgi:hypothetical protein
MINPYIQHLLILASQEWLALKRLTNLTIKQALPITATITSSTDVASGPIFLIALIGASSMQLEFAVYGEFISYNSYSAHHI